MINTQIKSSDSDFKTLLVIESYKLTGSMNKTAKELKISAREVWQRLHDSGIEVNNRGRPKKEDMEQRRIKLYNSGMLFKDIAKSEGISRQALFEYYKGLTREGKINQEDRMKGSKERKDNED